MPHPSAIPAVAPPVEAKGKSSFVRGARRHEISVRGLLTIAPASTSVVRWSAGAGVKDGILEVDAIDLSKGGMGVIGLVFVPRGTVVRVKLLAPTSEAQVLLDVTGVVRRVTMIDRRPAYQFGISFGELDADTSRNISQLLEMLNEGDVQPSKEASHA
jgi:hypothetical protein